MKFIIETGQPDRNGDVVQLDGLQFTEPVLVLRDFSVANLLGQARVYVEGSQLMAEANLPLGTDGYPAIGFSILQEVPNEHGGRTITAAKLRYVSISATPNVDPTIKRLSEQAQ